MTPACFRPEKQFWECMSLEASDVMSSAHLLESLRSPGLAPSPWL
jgi:hypothetical protein